MRILLAFMVGIVLLSGCNPERKAQKAFNNGEYQNAITLYKKLNSREPAKAKYFIAESYRLSNRLKDAAPYYAVAGGRGIDKDSVKFYYAQALKANGNYDEAKTVLEDLSANASNDGIKDRANADLQGITYLASIRTKPSFYKIKNLEALNTPASEYSPVYLNNELYFTSSRGGGKIYEAEGKPFTRLYKVTTRGANVDVATIAELPASINTENVNNGSITFTPDGKTMVFAKGNNGKKKGAEDVDLYLSRFRNGVWSDAQIIPGSVNTPKYWDSTPAFSIDGRTMYFASNRDGGYGGTDIYAATMDSRGRFTRVRNLGPEINTPGDELFPYVAEDAKLYFASDGHAGFGGLDLFVVKRANGKTIIENLGEPMNSSADDFAIFLFRPDRGFFSSNRDGGKGDDDVYTFVNEDPNLKVVNYYLAGITYTPDKEGNRQILPNTKVSLMDMEGTVMQDYVTGNDGKFLFRVYENESYELVGENDGYLVKRQGYTTKGKSVDVNTLKDLITNITLDTLMVLDKIELNKAFVLDNIYYDFNKFDIRPDAAKELDKLVQILVDNPEIKIELSSHTDSVDTEEYNLWLSQKRAESAVSYIVKRGIAPDRIIPKGYGESRPIARNTNPDGTDNPAGRQRNRRTEFKILEVGLIPKSIEEEEKDEYDEDKYFKKGDN